jgi:hypothetical protein
MTVTDLVTNFRAALLGVLPSVERVGIPWKRPAAYDEWDNLVEAMYQVLIVEPLRFSLPETERERFNLPGYDMLLPTYEGRTIIEVVPRRSDELIRVFHAFGTVRTPFDVVEWRAVESTGTPRSDVLETSPFEEARFALSLLTRPME